jgi:hypothetical protein
MGRGDVMPIVRVLRHEHNYVILDKTGLNDTRLSFRARGLLTYLLTKPDNWEIRYEDLVAQSPSEGRISIASAFHELEAIGYAKRERVKGHGGKFTGWETIVYECPTEIIKPDIGTEVTKHNFGAEVAKPDFGECVEKSSASSEVTKPDFGEPVQKSVQPNFGQPDLSSRIEKKLGLKKSKKDPLSRVSPRSNLSPISKFVPDTFVVTEALRLWAAREVPAVDIDWETAQMRDHEYKDPHSDWAKAWRKWMRNAAARLSPRGGQSTRSGLVL